jgi:hypothetical protein
MKFVLLFGPPAVGKMTVGRALANLTGLKLFHNHMTIELVLPFFDFGTPAHNRLVGLFRKSIFNEVAQSNLKGLIFTFVWALDLKSEEKYVDKIIKIFEGAGAEIFYVELEASLEERLQRNKSPERLEHKPSKRDLANSERIMLEHVKSYRFNTAPNEFKRKNYLKIDNTQRTAHEVAQIIKSNFNL